MNLNDLFDARAEDYFRTSGVQELTARDLSAALGCFSAVASLCLKRLERAGKLTSSRQAVRGWQKAGPGSGKSPITHKVAVTYQVVRCVNACAAW